MQITDEIHEHVKKMPIEMAREVLNFIEFLELKQNTSKQSLAVTSDEVMSHFQESLEKNRRLGELLAK